MRRPTTSRVAPASIRIPGLERLESRLLFVAGELDLNFSADGKQFTDFGDTDTARAAVVQPDGKTVVVGDWDGGSADFAIARYLPNGNLDSAFSGDGKQNLTFGAGTFGGVERATSVALQADGKIVVAGYTDAGTAGGIDPFDFAVARLNADGTLDNTFSGNGKFTHNFGNDDRANAVAVQPDGKIVVVGSWDGGAGHGRHPPQLQRHPRHHVQQRRGPPPCTTATASSTSPAPRSPRPPSSPRRSP